MSSNLRSGAQGVSGKSVKVGKMFSDRGSQIVTAKGKSEVQTMDNRGYKPRALPFSSIKIREITIIKVGFSFIDSIVDNIVTFFKK